MAKKPVEDDTLTPKAAPAKKAAAKKPVPPAAKKAAKKPAAPPAEDDVLAPAAKKAKKAAPEEAKEPDDYVAVRLALSKCKKLTSYTDVAETGKFNIRSVRRTARAMRDEGLLDITKEGTAGFVKVKK